MNCPDCHYRACLCDHVLCQVCEERHEHVDRAVACSVPGCPNDQVCGYDFQCYELVDGKPICVECINALDADWRLRAAVRLPVPALTAAELSKMVGVPAGTIRRWEHGVLVGSSGYERMAILEDRTVTALFAFIRDAAAHPTLRSVPSTLIVAAFQAVQSVEIPMRFKVPPPVAW